MSECSRCRKALGPGWSFCPFCGKAVAAAREPVAPPPVGHPLHERRFFGEKPGEIVECVKACCPNHVVFVQNGFFWETYDDDARLCSSIFGWRTADRGHGVFTGVAVNAWRFKVRLREIGVSFVFVKQAEYPSTTKEVERVVSEFHTAPGE